MHKDVEETTGGDESAEKSFEQNDLETFLKVGKSVMYQSDILNVKSPRFEMQIVGWKRGQYIILEFKEANRTRSTVLSGSRSVIRFVSAGRPCAMRIQSLDSIVEKNAPFFRVSWPAEVQTTVLRSEKRHGLSLPCTIDVKGDLTIPAEVIDLSSSGCKLAIELLLEVDDPVELSCTFPSGHAIGNVKCRVCHVTKTLEGCIAGCSIESISVQAQDELTFFLTLKADHTEKASLTRNSILFFDGQNDALDGLVQELESRTTKTLIVSDTVRAITWVGLQKALCMFVNASLSDHDSSAMVRLVRQSGYGKTIPIYLYGETESTLLSKVKESGATGHVTSLTDHRAIQTIIDGFTPMIESPQAEG